MSVTSQLSRCIRSPLAWIFAIVGLLHVIAINWGLPASDGWDNDGVAPRDCLAGLVETVTPGSFYAYPPVHIALLGLLTLPITLVALIRAHSLAPADVVREIIAVPYMTAIAYVARAVSVAMSLGIVYAVAKIAEELRGGRAGWCAGAVCGANAVLTYYAHTSNLDVPYLFWAFFALLALVRAVARREPRRLRSAMVLAVLAVGTKDQAYALFLLAAPATMAAWFLLDPYARRASRGIAREAAIALGIGGALFLVTDGVLLNPTGFRARLSYLVGPASQNFVQYSADWHGRALALEDVVRSFPRYYPLVFALFAAGGFASHIRRSKSDRAKLVAGLIPLFVLLSFTITFNCVARRTDHRFVLPQSLAIAVYAGIGIDGLLAGAADRMRVVAWLARAVVALAFALALFMCADVDANLLLDPRYDAENWLSEHVAPGDTIEVHGLNVYLPRLPSWALVTRVGPEPLTRRNPLPGVVEVQDLYDNAKTRRPKWIVLSEGWAWRYLIDVRAGGAEGRVFAPGQIETGSDRDGTGFFSSLMGGRGGYEWAHAAHWPSKFWPRLEIHASTAREIWIFRRIDP